MAAHPDMEVRKHFTGNGALYQDLDRHRERVMLQRNIKKVLSHHQKHANHQAKRSDALPPARPKTKGRRGRSSGIVKARQRSAWKVDRVFDQDTSPEEPTVRLSFKGICRKPGVSTTLGAEPQNKKVRCICAITIWDSTREDKRSMIQDSRECEIDLSRLHEDEILAPIQMEEDFVFKARRLQVPIFKNGSWNRGISDEYLLRVSISPLHGKQTWPMFPTNHSDVRQASLSDCVSTKIKLVPSKHEGFIAELEDRVGGNRTRIGYSLCIGVQWATPRTQLQLYNSKLTKRPITRLPTPPMSDTDPTAVPVSLTYVLGNWFENDITDSRTIEVVGFLCPLCSGRDFGSFELLHFHLSTGHPLFKFGVRPKDYQQESQADNYTIRIDASEDQPVMFMSANKLKAMQLLNWVRPKKAFDLSRYLAGDESWAISSVPTAAGMAPSVSLTNGLGETSSQQPDGIITGSIADLVPEIPTRNKRKFKVPPAPRNITFFRTGTKRPLREGEELSESDDEVDEEWLKQKHSETIDDFTDLSTAEKEFIKKFDTHMLEENLPAQAYVPHALIRFCRANKEWLQQEDMLHEFTKKVSKLLLYGVISVLDIRKCLELIRDLDHQVEQPASENVSQGEMLREVQENRVPYTNGVPQSKGDEMEIDDEDAVILAVKNGDDVEMHDVSNNRSNGFHQSTAVTQQIISMPDEQSTESRMKSHDSSTQSKRPSYGACPPHLMGTCLCGERVKAGDLTVACSNEGCWRGGVYHLACVGLQEPRGGWVCHDCRAKTMSRPLPIMV